VNKFLEELFFFYMLSHVTDLCSIDMIEEGKGTNEASESGWSYRCRDHIMVNICATINVMVLYF
jgi:hypothetical protein